MSKRLIKDFDSFREAISTYRLPRVILTALDLKVFTVIGTRTWTIPALAKQLRVNQRGLEILCRNLATAGLLKKTNDLYRNSELAQTELNRDSPQYRGAYVDLLRTQWDDWSQLTESVKRGRPVDREEPDNPTYRRQFSWAMHQRSKDAAPQIAAQLRLRGVRTLLDLGGGPGTYALEFLARNPRLQATVCDRASALSVARTIARSLKHGSRLSYLPLDFMKKPLPGSYDMIWYSNVMHIYSPEENQRLFTQLVKNLAPTGRLYIQDAFTLDRQGLEPADTNLFAVTMLLFTQTGNTYSAAATTQWLREAGFGKVRRVSLRKGTGDWAGGILEASHPRSS